MTGERPGQNDSLILCSALTIPCEETNSFINSLFLIALYISYRSLKRTGFRFPGFKITLCVFIVSIFKCVNPLIAQLVIRDIG